MNITTLEPIVREHPLFAGLGDDIISLISGCAKNVRFKAGDVLARQGDPANEFFLVREGRLAIDLPAPQTAALRLQTIDAGEAVGWSWLMPPYEWHFDVRAVTETRALSMDGKCLRDKCEADPKLGYELMKRFSHLMVERLVAMRLQLFDLYRNQSGASHST